MRRLDAGAKARDIVPEPFEGLLIMAPSAGSFAGDPGVDVSVSRPMLTISSASYSLISVDRE
jgi:hypothetical protein